jgi:dienelactone hydrolase
MMRLACWLSVFALALSGAAQLANAEPVSFPGKDITLTGELFRPQGVGPFPAVVALHGCGGLNGKKGGLSPRHEDWAKRLAEAGFLVLFPDSFSPRGAPSQCRSDNRTARASRERIGDALAAADYLKSRQDVKPDAINLLGWSNGGSTVLFTLREAARGRSASPFAKSVAFYPGCRTPLERADWHTRIPLLLLIGEADDWTPVWPCRGLASNAAVNSEPVTLVTYPGAYHDFDHPNLPVHVRRGLAFTANNNGVAHTGTDPAARADAIDRVLKFLAR